MALCLSHRLPLTARSALSLPALSAVEWVEGLSPYQSNGITCAIANSSDSDEVGKSHERYPDCDKENGVGNEIREDHQDQPADEGDDHLLLPAVQEKAEPD